MAFTLVASLVVTGVPAASAQEEGPPGEITLAGTVRDFQRSHPDFEYRISTDWGIVTDTIGADRKPVYAYPPGESSPTTNGAELGDLEDQVFSDIIGKEPDPDTARAIGCVGGSTGFFGGTGVGPTPAPAPVTP